MQHSQCRPNINTTLWLGWAQSCAKSSVRVRYTSLRKRQKLGHKKQKWVLDRGKYQDRPSLATPWINCQSSLMMRGCVSTVPSSVKPEKNSGQTLFKIHRYCIYIILIFNLSPCLQDALINVFINIRTSHFLYSPYLHYAIIIRSSTSTDHCAVYASFNKALKAIINMFIVFMTNLL